MAVNAGKGAEGGVLTVIGTRKVKAGAAQPPAPPEDDGDAAELLAVADAPLDRVEEGTASDDAVPESALLAEAAGEEAVPAEDAGVAREVEAVEVGEPSDEGAPDDDGSSVEDATDHDGAAALDEDLPDAGAEEGFALLDTAVPPGRS